MKIALPLRRGGLSFPQSFERESRNWINTLFFNTNKTSITTLFPNLLSTVYTLTRRTENTQSLRDCYYYFTLLPIRLPYGKIFYKMEINWLTKRICRPYGTVFSCIILLPIFRPYGTGINFIILLPTFHPYGTVFSCIILLVLYCYRYSVPTGRA